MRRTGKRGASDWRVTTTRVTHQRVCLPGRRCGRPPDCPFQWPSSASSSAIRCFKQAEKHKRVKKWKKWWRQHGHPSHRHTAIAANLLDLLLLRLLGVAGKLLGHKLEVEELSPPLATKIIKARCVKVGGLIGIRRLGGCGCKRALIA